MWGPCAKTIEWTGPSLPSHYYFSVTQHTTVYEKDHRGTIKWKRPRNDVTLSVIYLHLRLEIIKKIYGLVFAHFKIVILFLAHLYNNIIINIIHCIFWLHCKRVSLSKIIWDTIFWQFTLRFEFEPTSAWASSCRPLTKIK